MSSLCDLRNQTLHCIEVLSMKYKEKPHSVNIDTMQLMLSQPMIKPLYCTMS